MKISIFDSTLRDGAQCEGISYSVYDKIAITQYLDAIGVDYIEGGNPAFNPKDREFFEEVKKLELKNSKLVAFTSTHKIGIKPEEDDALKNVLNSGVDCVAVFGKSSVFHVTEILGTTKVQNLMLIEQTIKYLKDNNKYVFYDAEHFFDGYAEDKEYALSTIVAAKDAGADVIVLCDTNGGVMPDTIFEVVKEVKEVIGDIELGIHAHNDAGMADANSYFAVKAGATQVHGTFCGIGERCGNANLCTVIGTLQTKMGYTCIPPHRLESLTQVARSISEISNIDQNLRAPYVGVSAFSHKGGMHSDAVMKNSKSYEHISPELVGNKRSVLISEMGGRASILPAIQSVEPTLDKESDQTKSILKKLKKLEHKGYDFEGAEGSIYILAARELGKFKPHFDLVEFSVMVSEPVIDTSATAMITISVDGKNETTAAKGHGPVNALDNALRKALETFYPDVSKMYFSDYKVRILNSKHRSASLARVMITSSDGKNVWRTVGVSPDIIQASWHALVDSFEYYLTELNN